MQTSTLVRSIGDDVADLLICVEEIDRRLSERSTTDKWQWRSRRNVAIFLLSRLADKANNAGIEVDVHAVAQEQRQRVLSGHPLVGPISEYTVNTSTAISSVLGQHVRNRLNHLHSS